MFKSIIFCPFHICFFTVYWLPANCDEPSRLGLQHELVQLQANDASLCVISVFWNVTENVNNTLAWSPKIAYHLWHWSIFVLLNGFHRTFRRMSRELQRLVSVSFQTKCQTIPSRLGLGLKSVVHTLADHIMTRTQVDHALLCLQQV